VIADLMPSVNHQARDLGEPARVEAALKEGGFHVVAGQHVQEFGRAFAGTVVKGERDGFAIARAFVDGGSEHAGGSPAHAVRQDGSRAAQRS
jgi:hypothetical protein